MSTLKEAAWVARTTLQKKKSDHLFIFNQSILFNSRIIFIYKNKLNKKTINKNTRENPIKLYKKRIKQRTQKGGKK
jgi:hypothetical protein